MGRLTVAIFLIAGLGSVPSLAEQLPSPHTCTAAVTPGRVQLGWGRVETAQTYSIFRDGDVLGTAEASLPTNWVDFPPPGTHLYCIRAEAPGFTPSDPCCVRSANAYPPAKPDCSASSDIVGKILFQWSDVDGETRYVVTRDGFTVYQAPANVTSFLDPVGVGSYIYCVSAVDAVGTSEPCCSQGFGAQSTEGRWRLSWGTCSPQVSNQSFNGPGLYTLVLSLTDASQPNLGHDTEITIRPAVPDAWRFDVAGCQTSISFDARREGLGPTCPVMVGKFPLSIASYNLSPVGDGSAVLRVATTYDTFVPNPSQRYVLSKIVFDHRYSIAGHDSDPETCDGADWTLGFSAATTILMATGSNAAAVHDPEDMLVQWNGDSPVASTPTTWGRVKSLYR